MDVARLRESFRRVGAHGDNFALFFYAHLFLAHPETREMFPASMAEQRRHLLAALAHIVAAADDPGRFTGYLEKLGVTHRRGFGVLHDGGHYEAVGASLLAALEHFEAGDWAPEVAADWAEAYGLIAGIMAGAAREDGKTAPPQWAGTVTASQWRSHNVAVLRVQAEPALRYLPGQAVRVQVPSRPRIWRWYSAACPPREDGMTEFHVRATGTVGLALATAPPGTRLQLMPPGPDQGMRLRDTTRPVLMAASSAGLAPMKAMTEHLAATSPRAVHLVWGAADAEGMYLWAEMTAMARECPWLAITPVPGDGLADAVTAAGPWNGYDAYIAGPSATVRDITARLTGAGMPASLVTGEDFGWDEP